MTVAPPAGTLDIVACAATNVGRRRELNEDAALAQFPVFVVADGMGGHAAGEVAAARAIDAFATLLDRRDVAAVEIPEVLATAQRDVLQIVADGGGGAGCTVSGAIAVLGQGGLPHWQIFNVGDARTYVAAGGSFVQVTRDHSVLQEMLDAGELEGVDPAHYPSRNVITRAIGGEDHRADYWSLPIVPGQRLLVCSDGLTSELSEAEIERILAESATPEDAVRSLVDGAVAAGGRDNVTVVLVQVTGQEPSGGPAQAGSMAPPVVSGRTAFPVALPPAQPAL